MATATALRAMARDQAMATGKGPAMATGLAMAMGRDRAMATAPMILRTALPAAPASPLLQGSNQLVFEPWKVASFLDGDLDHLHRSGGTIGGVGGGLADL